MTKYLEALHDATIPTNEKKVDTAFIYTQKPTKIVLFDLFRTTEAQEDSQKHFLDRSLFAGGGPQEWASGVDQVREQDCILPAALCDLLCEF